MAPLILEGDAAGEGATEAEEPVPKRLRRVGVRPAEGEGDAVGESVAPGWLLLNASLAGDACVEGSGTLFVSLLGLFGREGCRACKREGVRGPFGVAAVSESAPVAALCVVLCSLESGSRGLLVGRGVDALRGEAVSERAGGRLAVG
jgi:hypothetical protein